MGWELGDAAAFESYLLSNLSPNKPNGFHAGLGWNHWFIGAWWLANTSLTSPKEKLMDSARWNAG